MVTQAAFKIGCCKVQPSDFSIQFDNASRKSIQPKYIEVLSYLAKFHPRVITREELIDNIWDGNQGVGEKALTNTIWHLRQCLAGANGEHDVIETIRKAGYRLLTSPTWLDEDHSSLSKIKEPNSRLMPESARRYSDFAIALFALTLITISILYATNTNKNNPLLNIEHITRQPGSELFAAPSPDGRYLVYQWINLHGQINLYLYDRQQPKLPHEQLTFSQSQEGHSVWSNDGQFLYFSRQDTRTSSCKIIQLKVETRQEKPIVNCGKRGGYQYLDISPDGNTLAFHALFKPEKKSGIYLLDLTSDKNKPIRFSCATRCDYKDRDMAFSPDGTTLAITRRKNWHSENIYLIDIETKSEQQLSVGLTDIVGLTWHPDGKHIIYATQDADKRNGYVLALDSHKVVPLNIAGFSYPAYSKDTAELFYQDRHEQYLISSLNLLETKATSPFPVLQSEFSHRYPDYSVATNKIVYVSNESDHYELWVSEADGQNRQQLTNLRTTVRSPRWSNDGKNIVFLAPKDDSTGDKIYIINVASKQISIVPTAHNEHGEPNWNYNDTAIITAVKEGKSTDLYQFTLTDGEAERLTFNGATYGIMPNKNEILYTGNKGALWRQPIETSTPVKVLKRTLFDVDDNWTYHDNGVFFHRSASNHHQFFHYDIDESKLTQILRLPAFQQYGGITIDPIGGKLLFTNNHFPQADIKILQHPLLP